LNKNKLKHISFILDGNKRWAKKNKLKNSQGYIKGIEKIYEIVEYCYKKKIDYVTLFLLSSENVNRKSSNAFFNIAKNKFNDFIFQINKIGKIKINVIGERDNLPNYLLNAINKLENDKIMKFNLELNLAFNYGFNNELKHVISNIVSFSKNKDFSLDKINIEDFFYLKNQPDPDILIRTGGYKRLSNFILKNLVYTEMNFIETLWPDFSINELEKIILNFKNTNRNYGL